MTLEKEECEKRRSKRAYDPPDVKGYFDKVVWPAYVGHRETAEALDAAVTMLSGETAVLDNAKVVAADVIKKATSQENVDNEEEAANGQNQVADTVKVQPVEPEEA